MSASDPVVQRRATTAAITTMIASAGIALVVVGMLAQFTLPGLVAVGAGLLVPAGAAVSVVRRTPALCTPADRVTLLRAVLIGGSTTVIVLSLFGFLPVRSWWLIGLAVPALILDAVDGWVARRTGTASAYGARMDMEVDAAFLVVLSAAAAVVVGPWVLAIGAMRYLFAAAAWWRPALGQKLAYSSFRRFVAGLQGAALAFALAPMIPVPVGAAAAAAALALLIVSFGKDVVFLERTHRAP